MIVQGFYSIGRNLAIQGLSRFEESRRGTCRNAREECDYSAARFCHSSDSLKNTSADSNHYEQVTKNCCRDSDKCISTIHALFPQQKICLTLLHSVRSRVCFKSTEEKSSRRRKQTRGHQENRQRISRGIRATGCFGWNRESFYSERNDGRVKEPRAARFASLERVRSDRSCGLEAEPDLQKIGRRGEIPQGKSPLRFSTRLRQLCRMYTK